MPVELPEDRPRFETSLRDGSQVILSPVTPADRGLLEEGLDHMSIQSRYTRFGQGRDHLSERELTYLTDLDLRNHVAWGAAIGNEPAGVGRYIVLPDAGCAEVAVTVVDSYQRRGLGTVLFRALVAVARADGVLEFCFQAVEGNVAVTRMSRGLNVMLQQSAGLIEGRVVLADLPMDPSEPGMLEVMNATRGAPRPVNPPSRPRRDPTKAS